MPLVRCLYASRIAGGSTAAVAEAILAQSRPRNAERGITGLLCCGDEIFVQVLEGGRDEVCELYNGIARDARHTNVRLLVYEEIAARRFGNWSMGLVNAGAVNPAILLRHGKRAALDPFSVPGASTMALLDELISVGAISMRGP